MRFFWNIVRKGFLIATGIAAIPILMIVVLGLINPPVSMGDTAVFGVGVLFILIGICYLAALVLIVIFAACVEMMKKGRE